MIVYFFLSFYTSFFIVAPNAQVIEQFHIRGPSELQKVAIDVYLEERKKNPKDDGVGDDSATMKRAQEHAVKRFATTATEELVLKRKVGQSAESLLQLPAPENSGGFLAAAISSTSSSGNELVTTDFINSMTVQITEDIGLGAISRAGALPLGENSGWIKFAEDKLKRDAKLDYQALLWELGSEVVEKTHINSGGLNITLENSLLENAKEWFGQKGGKLKYITPSVSQASGFVMKSSEDIHQYDVVISAPLATTLCRISARNVVIPNKSKYLGEELKKTFERNEVWGLTIFLLHEWYKETAGTGSKWGPYLRLLRLKALSTPVLQALKGTMALQLLKKWTKDADALRHWSTGIDGPCGPTSNVCRTKPKDKFSDSRYDLHQIRWAYFVVQQNAITIRHSATGKDFLALVPFSEMLLRDVSLPSTMPLLNTGSGSSSSSSSLYSSLVSLDLDGSISIRTGKDYSSEDLIGVAPTGNLTDAELFLKYLKVSDQRNPANTIAMNLPGALPAGSALHSCLKLYDKKACRADSQGGALQWKIKTLSEWRKAMNLPPRLGELRLWATRLHLYGDDEDEINKLSSTNQLLAGLPVSTSEVAAEDQLMLLGMAKDNQEASSLVAAATGVGSGRPSSLTAYDSESLLGGERPPPQLYTAPDPEEDPEAKRSMENLATLAVQIQNAVSGGNLLWNATRAVLNQTREFFQYGVLPQGGLDLLDDFLLKKLGLLSHCGVGRDMKIVSLSEAIPCEDPSSSNSNSSSSSSSGTNHEQYSHNSSSISFTSSVPSPFTRPLMCAMRVHLLSENETHIFCPADAKIWENNCQEVQFSNYTAMSLSNELLVVQAFRSTLTQMLSSYPTSLDYDREILRKCSSSSSSASSSSASSSSSECQSPDSPTLDSSSVENNSMGDIMLSAIRLRMREKLLISDALEYLLSHEVAALNGSIPFQLDQRRVEREIADKRQEAHLKYMKEVSDRAALRLPLAVVPVDLGVGNKINLTLLEGQDLKVIVQQFCQQNKIAVSYVSTLEKALRERVVNPKPLALILGVVLPTGQRDILGIEENANSTVETGVFCVRNGIVESDCDKLQKRVAHRLNPSYPRRLLTQIIADAPDARKLTFIIREGEQHDISQLVADYFQYYHMPPESINTMIHEIQKRLPNPALQIPVSLTKQRQVSMKVAVNDNITTIVAGFTDFFDIDESVKPQLLRLAQYGMAPGSFLL